MLELEKNKILPVLISYTVPYADMLVDTDGWDWIKIALRSFHAHFPGERYSSSTTTAMTIATRENGRGCTRIPARSSSETH